MKDKEDAVRDAASALSDPFSLYLRRYTGSRTLYPLTTYGLQSTPVQSTHRHKAVCMFGCLFFVVS